MKKYRVPVEWISLVYLEVDAFDLNDLKKKLSDNEILKKDPLFWVFFKDFI